MIWQTTNLTKKGKECNIQASIIIKFQEMFNKRACKSSQIYTQIQTDSFLCVQQLNQHSHVRKSHDPIKDQNYIS